MKYLKYDRKKFLREENSIENLTDVKKVESLVEFIKKNPFPTDEQLHGFADEQKIDADEMEQYAYAIISVILTGGKSKGKEADADKENKDIGLQIEMEHVETDIDNPVIKKIQDILKTKIMSDHLFEDSKYYEAETFRKELEKENK